MSRATSKDPPARAARRAAPSDAPAPSVEFGAREHVLLVLDRLDAEYGNESLPAGFYSTGEPLDGLLVTLLSQNTNDRNRDAAYETLRARYPSWADVARVSREEVADAIRSAGLGDTKSARMKAILDRVKADFGDYSLAAMKDWDAARVKEYLSGLEGIGPKTVACVMVFDLGLPAFPVDTHVARVSRRLGWAREKAPPEAIQEFLEQTTPPERCGGGHLNMISHGRKVCHARNPECGVCALADICRSRAETGGRP